MAFSERIKSTPALREELTALSTDVAGIVALGEREGFTFSAADVMAMVQSKRSESAEPLSEEELEQVAGGTAPAPTVTCVGGPPLCMAW